MAMIDNTDIAFNGQEVKSLSEAIYERVFLKPSITQFHDIQTGIKASKQIAFLGKLGMIGKKRANCATTADGNTLAMTEKFWNPEYVGGRDEECWDQLKETFFIWGLKNGYQKHDLTGTEFAMFYEDRLADALAEAIHRIVWFGKTDISNVSDGGTLTGTVSTSYYDIIDGLWEQIYDDVIANPSRNSGDFGSGLGLTTKNSQATYVLQNFNDTDTTNKIATRTLQNMKFTADMRLRDDASAFGIMTQSVADQYERERASANLESSVQILENGLTAYKVGGINFYAFPLWDRYILSSFNNGTKLVNPHRVLLTTKDNIQVGTEELKNFSEFNPFYSQDDKVYRCDYGFNIDAKLMQSYLYQACY